MMLTRSPLRPRLLALALTLGLGGSFSPLLAQPAPPAAQIAWDLSPLFASEAAWDAEREALRAELPALAALREGFTRDATRLRAGLDRISAATQRLRRVGVFASAQASTDNRDARNQERQALMRHLGGEFGAALAWVDGAIAAAGAERIEAFIAAEPGLARHAPRLRNTLRKARHQLSPETEAALAALGPVLRNQGQTRTLLTTVDTEWPTLQIEGRSERINDTGYSRLRAHPDRAVREQVFQAFYSVYGRLQNTLGSTLGQRVEAGVTEARLRGYPSAVAASLAENDIPESVYRTLVAEANAGLPTLHRYLKMRQRLLKLPDLQYHDIYPDLIASERRFSPEESARLITEAVAPLGADYQAKLRRALAANTMHVYPAPGKSSGAYQSGVYGMTPLVFLNHQDTFNSASTYAHEWGHGMHTILANESQPFETAGYPLFLAEIASFTHELLLQEHMLKQSRSREERLFFLSEAIERLRSSFFRQTMFAEFELAVHDSQQRGEPLTGQRMSALYCGLLRKYHGADAGVMKIAPNVCSEWAFVSHFYRPFYVYQYATSMAAAQHFASEVLSGQTAKRENYLNILRSGGSVHPVPLLKRAGLDMDSPAPYRALVRQMDRLLDEMEALLATPARS